MKRPIDILFDKIVWHCTRCGSTTNCNCWFKVKLHCRKCGREKVVINEPSDPVGTAVIDCVCDRCDNVEGRAEVLYFDARGRQYDGTTFRAIRKRLCPQSLSLGPTSGAVTVRVPRKRLHPVSARRKESE